MSYKKGVVLVKQKSFRMFLFAFLISLTIWLLNNLSKTYEKIVDVKLSYSQLDTGDFVKDADSILRVKIKGSGFALLSQKKTDLHLSINTRKANEGWQWDPGNSELDYLFSKNVSIITTSPKQLNFKVKTLSKKRVPIISQMKVIPKFGYGITDYSLSKDSIFIYGDEDNLGEITDIKTDSLVFNELTESISGKIQLNYQQDRFQIEEQKIDYSYDIEQFTQGGFSVKIAVKNIPEDKEVTIFPKEVHVQFQGAVSKFSSYTADDFSVYVDVNAMNDTNTLPIQIERMTSSMQNVRVLKKSVTYLVLDK